MPKNHTVVQGECLSSIATAEGFRDWHTIYNDPANADFRTLRPNPNLLFPGDIIVIPDKTPSSLGASTGQPATFTVKSNRVLLRLRLADTAAPNYRLSVDGKVTTGTVDSSGIVEADLSPSATDGTLTTWPDGFDSPEDAGDAAVTWSLQIGSLDPATEISGVQARLANLGYAPGGIDGIDGPRTQSAVKAFQADNPPLVVDGICGPKTRAVLIDAYGM
jgi:hypothetical protein